MKNIFANFHNQLAHLYDASEIQYMCQLTLEKVLGLNFANIETLKKEEQEQLEKYLHELVLGRPLQYVLGETYFWDQFFKVAEGVLIPRPETEELLYWIKKDYEHKTLPSRIIDLGTGSGCIAIILKKLFPDAEVWALDVSENALAIAKKNAQNLNINFVEGSLLDSNTWENLPEFDLIVSNPPYITMAEKDAMHTNVLAYEPHLALFVSNGDVQQFYKAILGFSRNHLQSQGAIYLELNAGYANETKHIYQNAGFEATIQKDMQYKDRMLKAVK